MSRLRLVFVHLNTNFPPHLMANIKRMKSMFPEMEVHLIHNLETSFPDDLGIFMHRIETSRYDLDFKNHKWDTKFRKGFWQSSLSRILVLEQFHEQFPLDPILHLESDVILMKNFPFQEISKLGETYWNSFGTDSDVGALIYSPTFNATTHLVDALRDAIRANPYITDMSALNMVRRNDPDKFKVLPTSSSDKSFKNIPFIFDGAIIGMWLFGQDPRNHYGFQPRFLNLTESKYFVKKNTISLNAIGEMFLQEGTQLSTVVSLHLHCKDVRLFESQGELVQKRVSAASRSAHIVLFKPKIFFTLAYTAINERQVKAFLYNFPLLGKILRMMRVAVNAVIVMFSKSERG